MCHLNKLEANYGFVIVFAGFLGHVIIFGFTNSVGVFYVEFQEHFPDFKGSISLISSLNTGCLYAVGFIASVLTQKCGPRVVCILGGIISGVALTLTVYAQSVYALYFSFGIFAGLGMGLCYIPISTIVPQYFSRRRTLAVGFSVCGAGIGNIVFPPLVKYFLHLYGWRGSSLLLGGISLNLCVCGCLLRSPKSPIPIEKYSNDSIEKQISSNNGVTIESTVLSANTYDTNDVITEGQKCSQTQSLKEEQPEGKSSSFNFQMLKNINFIIFCLNNLLVCFGMAIVYMHLPAYAVSIHIDHLKAALLISIIGFGNFFGRLFWGVVANAPGTSAMCLYNVSYFCFGIVTVLFTASENYGWLMCIAVLFGVFNGPFGTLVPQVTVDIVGLDGLVNAYGYLLFVEGIGALSGPPVAEWLHNASHDYKTSFYLAGGSIVLSSLIMTYPWFKNRHKL